MDGMRKFIPGKRILLFFLMLETVYVQGQIEGLTLGIVNEKSLFKPIVAIEAWATYSTGESKGEVEYSNRGDISLRRFRFGATGNPYYWLKYHFQVHFDRFGEDPFSSTKGSFNGIGIWDAYLTAKLIKDSDLLNLHVGYFWAAISRDFHTSCWSVSSFDKTRATWYLRSFVAGKGNGIESGIGLAGLKNFEQWGIGYRFGTYEPKAYESSTYASRLYTGRLMVSYGDPEQKSYRYMLSGNKWNNRNGVTIGIGGSTQSDGKLNDSTYYNSNVAYGGDILINYGRFQVDAEYFIMQRTATELTTFDGIQWHLRAGYNLYLNQTIIEPTLTYEKFEGNGNAALFNHIGTDKTIDFGVNWYLNRDKLKLALHYVLQEGEASPNKGDFLGLAFQLRL